MRLPLLFVPAVLLAQTPAPKPAAAAKPKPAVAPKAAGVPKPAAPKAAAPKPPAAAAKPAVLASDEEKMIYALGLAMQRSMGQFDLSAAEIEIVKRAISDAANGKPAIELSEWGPRIESLGKTRQGRVLEREKAASRAYLDKAAAEPGAQRAESGLIYRELQPGSGAQPKAADTVKVHYRGTLINGTEFDSSYKRNDPAEFALNGVIKCWTEGLQKMKIGSKARLVCPSDIAYGDRGRPSIPPGAALIFEVELLGITPAPQ
jgi:FKBP-type peptidyl-prolyl cis-trans isomerase FkpA